MGKAGAQDSTSSATGSAAEAGAIGTVDATLGRYRLEHVLGAGAIGVVHAALDCDLHRRVAVKVLRSVSATREAKDRLLREARAMARLAHPNVVTVYEVGTANGRDFIAMELVRGEPLIQWLRAARRPVDAIVDAFVAAGRGLAAAHAAGIVHRDFKPHNVLLSRDGRVAVTDFGLARIAHELPLALDATTPLGGHRVCPPVALTSTGELLGTPAYMAPEQWQGGAVTPATDQFAFCVALWEALGGERPYRGQSPEALRREVVRGPRALDDSRIPRRLRALLRRGLDPDPQRRWASMAALLARLARARRGPRVALASACTLGAAATILAVRANGVAVECAPPARNVTAVWSPLVAAAVGATLSPEHAGVLDTAHRDWLAARAGACVAPLAVQLTQLACLDQVLERFDAIRRGYERVPSSAAEEMQAQLIDPAICIRPVAADVPRLALTASPTVIEGYALYAQSDTADKPSEAQIAALFDERNRDPCARVIAALAFDAASPDVTRRRAVMATARAADDQCGDARLHADLLIRGLPYELELPMIGPRGEAAIAQASAAVRAVMQPDLAAAVAQYRAIVAHQRARWDVAFREVEEELAGYRGRPGGQLFAVLMRNYLRLGRSNPDDLAAAIADVRTWRAFALAAPADRPTGAVDVRPWHPLALANHRVEIVRQLDAVAALARYRLGDASARGALIAAWQAQPRIERSSLPVTGIVVDTAGKPVAGARVAAATSLRADAGGLGLPDLNTYLDYRDPDLRTTTTDAAGRFCLDATLRIAAELDDRRSPARAVAGQIRLVLAPTRMLRGRIDLGDVPYTHVSVTATEEGSRAGIIVLGAIAPDGSFTIAGAPTTPLRLTMAVRQAFDLDRQLAFHRVAAGTIPVAGIRFEIPSSPRTLDVTVRSTVVAPLAGARVAVLEGQHPIHSVPELLELADVNLQLRSAIPWDTSLSERLRPGDLVAHVEHAPPDELTVCASSFFGDPLDLSLDNTVRFAQLAIRCTRVGPDARTVEIAVPPQLSGPAGGP